MNAFGNRSISSVEKWKVLKRHGSHSSVLGRDNHSTVFTRQKCPTCKLLFFRGES